MGSIWEARTGERRHLEEEPPEQRHRAGGAQGVLGKMMALTEARGSEEIRPEARM